MKLESYRLFYKNTLISNFIEIRPLGAEIFKTIGRHDEVNSRFSHLRERAQNIEMCQAIKCFCFIIYNEK
jgi:hypothetical protein